MTLEVVLASGSVRTSVTPDTPDPPEVTEPPSEEAVPATTCSMQSELAVPPPRVPFTVTLMSAEGCTPIGGAKVTSAVPSLLSLRVA